MTTLVDTAPFMVLFVQGAWHTDRHAAPLISSLKASGYHCETAPYPSNMLGFANPYTQFDHPDYTTPLKDLTTLPDAHTDAAAIQGKLEKLIEQEGKTVLMIAHSYGGRAASEAVDQKFSRTVRLKQGKKGGLTGVFYACAFPLPVGESMMTFCEGTEFLGFKAHPSGLATMQDPEVWLFSEMPLEQQQHWKSLLVPQSATQAATKVEYAGYLHVPCGYLLCENDKLVPISLQERLVKEMENSGAQVKTWRRPLGHEPALAWTEGLKDLLLEFGKECL